MTSISPTIFLIRRWPLAGADEINVDRRIHMASPLIVTFVGWVGVVIGGLILRRLPDHIDKRPMAAVTNPAHCFSSFGPSHEVLTDRGRKLLAASYIFVGGGLVLPGVSFVVSHFF